MNCPRCEIKNPDGAQICGSCGQVLKSDTSERPAAKPKTSRLAIASFIISFLGLPLFFLAGIPSIILGIIAIFEVSRSRGKLKGTTFAIAGIVISLFLMSVFFLWSLDAPPIPNDYTIADLRSAPPEYAETFELLKTLNKKEPNVPLESAIGLSEEDDKLLKQISNVISEGSPSEISEVLKINKDNIEKAWSKTEKAREIISKLNTFNEIADMTEPNVNFDVVDVSNTIKLARFYQAYIYLKIQQGNPQTMLKYLIEFDSVIRKFSLNARPLIIKLICFICLTTSIETANAIINDPRTPQEIVELIAKHFTPLTKEHLSLRNSILVEYLTMKYISTMESFKYVTVYNPMLKKNSTLRLYRNLCDHWIYILEGLQKSKSEELSVWPRHFPNCLHVSIDSDVRLPWFYKCYNPIGSVLTRLLKASFRLSDKITEIKIQDDLLQIVLNKRLGKEINLKARAYSEEYIVDLENKKIFSPGPDGIPHTKDDIKLMINPEVLNFKK